MRSGKCRRYWLDIVPPCFPAPTGYDPRGLPTGPDYSPFLKAGRDNRRGTAWGRFSPKAGRQIQCLSMGERNLSVLLDLNPYVVDIREQYPWATAQLLEKILEDPTSRYRRTDLFTLDFIATLQTAGKSHFLALSHKTEEESCRRDVLRRQERERAAVGSAGWTYQPTTNKSFDEIEVASAWQILKWAGDVHFNDVHAEARSAAELVVRLARERPLDEVLQATSRRLSQSLDFTYQLFAAAVCLGFLCLHLKEGVSGRRRVPIKFQS